MDPLKNDNPPDLTETTQRKVINPLNEQSVKDYVGQHVAEPEPLKQVSPGAIQPQSSVPSSPVSEPVDASKRSVAQTDADEEWKPNTRLSSRIPMLKKYSLVFIFGSLLFMYLSRNIWELNSKVTVILGTIVYTFLGVMLLSGLVMLFSKSKPLVSICLNLMLALSILVGAVSLLSLSIITIVFSVLSVGALLNLKAYVKKAA